MIETSKQRSNRRRKLGVQKWWADPINHAWRATHTYNKYLNIPPPPLVEIVNKYNKSFFIYNVKFIIEEEDLRTKDTYYVFGGPGLAILNANKKVNTIETVKHQLMPGSGSWYSGRCYVWRLKRKKLDYVKFYWNESQSITVPVELSEHWRYPFLESNPFGKLYELMSVLQMQIRK